MGLIIKVGREGLIIKVGREGLIMKGGREGSIMKGEIDHSMVELCNLLLMLCSVWVRTHID